MVERRHWMSQDRFVKIMAFSHMLPGPEALQLAIYVGYLKRGVLGGILAGLTFILPGAAVMVLLSWLYVTYGSLPQVTHALYILKPAVLGIIAAGIIKLGRAAIKNRLLAGLLVGAIVALWLGVDFLLVLLAAGLLNLLITQGLPRLRAVAAVVPFVGAGLGGMQAVTEPQWLRLAWVFLKTGLFSFGGAYASMAFLQRDAVDRYHWLTAGQLLDGVALSVATPGPFMLFTAFAGYLAGRLPGAILATFFVFLPSFVLVLIGAPYMEQVQHNRRIQAFLAGASAAVVGVILVVSLPLIPAAFVDAFSIAIGVVAFLVIVRFKVDVALVAVAAILGGVLYALVRALVAGG
jgi:chromate transporter